jgi:hypothetical protein
MKITVEITNFEELQKILLFFKSIQLEKVEVNYTNSEILENSLSTLIQKGDKTQDPTSLFGIWKDNPKTTQQIRTQNWKRDWNI